MSEFARIGTNSGHGHVWKRPDGVKARCGGPGVCRECSADFAMLNRSVQQGADTTASHLMEAMLPQLLIVFANRLGGKVEVPVTEIDGTGGWLLALSVDQQAGTFTFETQRKS